ncbi:MAG: LPS-assembly protein LptD [Calditrichaeota bacterium]|nr:MAG: LPS-assembly protein LptD [Calditrichota bacterium]MBL1204876.1 LPS-assembly protein LptD [Calditrichota bacterium]NOG44705.1 LPS-assembly protein LptD [Calditrichota bacterium]
MKILLFTLLTITYLFSQENQVLNDSLSTLMPDSIAVNDLEIADSLAQKPKPAITDKIPYKADHISISVDGNKIYLTGNAEINYQSLKLNAEKITIDQKNNKLYARGVLDSIDEKGNKVFKGNPVFLEKDQEPMRGNIIEYDFETKRGKIQVGRTNMEPGYYKGSDIYKIADSTLLVEDGYFTTCDLPEDPHFYFRSDQMRLRVKDKVVARPIYFYIADIPVAALPFGVFPNKGGRHSGIIIPSYGESRVGGRFLEGLGYYWAPNDYFDATLQTTFYDKLGFTFRGNANYKVRYLLGGSVSGSYFPKDPSSGQRRERWNFRFNHRQTIDPTFTISGSGSFSSDKDFRRDTSPSFADRTRQNITSSLNINKSFKGTKNSMSMSFTHQKNLQTDETDYTLPRITFSRRQTSIYETITGKPLGSKRSWYQDIYFSYSSNTLRKGSHKLQITQNDSLPDDTTYVDKVSSGIQHNLRFNSPQKIFKYFSVNPSVNYNEVWVDEITEGTLNEETNAIETSQKKKFGVRRTFNASVGLRTKLYGMFEPNIGELKFIRHIIDPSISMTYTPDFSTDQYGYFNTVLDTNGNIKKVDKFQRSPFGGTSSGESQRMNISLGNLFQAKFIDEEGKEDKVDFFKANFSTSHNFLADSLKWGRISSSFSTKIFGQNISARATHSLYSLSKDGTKEVDEFFFEQGNLPRLISFNTSFGYTINNKTFAAKEDKDKNKSRRDKRNGDNAEDKTKAEIDSLDEENFGLDGSLKKERDQTKKIELPWSTTFRVNYTLRPENENDPESINLTASANFKLTKNWKIRWNGSFDLVEKDLVHHSFNIYRDLHCWEMSFNWQPTQKYYSFQINIKAPSLQDIKVTKHPSANTYNRY